MSPLRVVTVVACLLAVVCATPSSRPRQLSMRSNSLSNDLRPTEWLSVSELESLPALDEITLQQMEKMSVEEGANLVNKIYHLAQINRDLEPTFTPNPNEIPAYIVTPNGQKINFNLKQLAEAAKKEPTFGDEEVTIFITGLPEQTESVEKANKKLVNAYLQRYNQQSNSNSKEDSNENSSDKPTGSLVVIDLGAVLNNFKRFAMLDIERTGAMVGNALAQLTDECDVPHETIHIIGQGIGAHVAGEAGRQYTRLTGHQLRRITGLDPSKIFAKNPNTLTGLARGDADFVDAIHTSTYGMGTPSRVAKVDFYPNGPSVAVSGSDNIVEAAMRATRYFAESVRPGNEINFPAVPASSFKQYRNKNGFGKRAYMGIGTDYDLKGDYMLEVNAQRPFGRRTPAQKQNTYHGVHQSLRAINAMDNE